MLPSNPSWGPVLLLCITRDASPLAPSTAPLSHPHTVLWKPRSDGLRKAFASLQVFGSEGKRTHLHHSQASLVWHAMLGLTPPCQLCQACPCLPAPGGWRSSAALTVSPRPVVGLWQLTTCSAKRGKTWKQRLVPALPSPQREREGGDCPRWRSIRRPAASPSRGRCDDPGGTARRCELSEPPELRSCTPRSSFPGSRIPPSQRLCRPLGSPAALTRTCCWWVKSGAAILPFNETDLARYSGLLPPPSMSRPAIAVQGYSALGFLQQPRKTQQNARLPSPSFSRGFCWEGKKSVKMRFVKGGWETLRHKLKPVKRWKMSKFCGSCPCRCSLLTCLGPRLTHRALFMEGRLQIPRQISWQLTYKLPESPYPYLLKRFYFPARVPETQECVLLAPLHPHSLASPHPWKWLKKWGEKVYLELLNLYIPKVQNARAVLYQRAGCKT